MDRIDLAQMGRSVRLL